jgi:hypothetical protein
MQTVTLTGMISIMYIAYESQSSFSYAVLLSHVGADITQASSHNHYHLASVSE